MKIRQKDLAQLVGKSETTVIQKARQIGVKPEKVSHRMVFYKLDDAIKIMKAFGMTDEEIAEAIDKIRQMQPNQAQTTTTTTTSTPKENENEKEEEVKKEVKETKTTKPPIPATYIQSFLKTVDKNLATTFTKFAEQVDWFTTAVNEIGLFAIITAMSTMKLTPDELEERLFSYRNPYEFVHDVVERLMALFRATEDAKAVYNLQKKINEYRYYLDKALDQIEELKAKVKQYEEEIMKLIAALYSYDKQFALGYIYAKGLDVARFKALISKDGRRPDEVEKKRIEVT